MSRHALVFGASGLLGWAVVNEIMNHYPVKGTFSKVTALTNRPLTLQDSLWPTEGNALPDLNIVSGIDLTRGTLEEFKEVIKRRIPDIETVTHIYYFAYSFHPDSPTETKINLAMFQRGFGAVESLAPDLQYAILPTGTKGYGVHIPNLEGFKAPYIETMGELPQPFRSKLFYFALRDEFNRIQQGKNWKWAEVRCDFVNGFVPHSSPYNLPRRLMNFLSLYKFMQEKSHPDAQSKQVPFPAPPASWPSLSNDCGQDIFAKFSIFLSLDPERAGNSELYNIADEANPRNFAEKWSYICSLFELEGIPPVDTSSGKYRTPASFIKGHPEQIKLLEEEKGITLQGVSPEGGPQTWMERFDFNHDLVIEKAKATGFKEEVSYKETWKTVFGRYEKAKKAYLGN